MTADQIAASWRCVGRLTVTTGPTVEPITIEDVKAHVRQPLTLDDAILSGYIRAARAHLEGLGALALLPQTITATYDTVPACGAPLLLPVGPVVSVTSVTSYDLSNTAATVSTAAYGLDSTYVPPRIYLNSGSSWPTARRAVAGLVVVAVAGYTAPATVPADLKQAVALLAAYWYEQRQGALLEPGITAVSDVPFGILTLLAAHRTRAGVA